MQCIFRPGKTGCGRRSKTSPRRPTSLRVPYRALMASERCLRLRINKVPHGKWSRGPGSHHADQSQPSPSEGPKPTKRQASPPRGKHPATRTGDAHRPKQKKPRPRSQTKARKASTPRQKTKTQRPKQGRQEQAKQGRANKKRATQPKQDKANQTKASQNKAGEGQHAGSEPVHADLPMLDPVRNQQNRESGSCVGPTQANPRSP